jgi:hypothetical protein
MDCSLEICLCVNRSSIHQAAHYIYMPKRSCTMHWSVTICVFFVDVGVEHLDQALHYIDATSNTCLKQAGVSIFGLFLVNVSTMVDQVAQNLQMPVPGGTEKRKGAVIGNLTHRGAVFADEASHHLQITLLSCHEQSRQPVRPCLIDVGTELIN